MKCLLLALTGMGNAVLEACLTGCGTRDVLVVTRAESGPYPYHSCENLSGACQRLGVRCLTGADLSDPLTLDALRTFAPSIALSATFHQIVRQDVLALPRLGIYNFHPSLLPAYKGPMPTNWAIIHGEARSGVTVHEMTPGLDEGRIVLQQAVDIGVDCDGDLRRRLAGVAGELAERLLDLAASGKITFREQEGAGSYHPRLLSPEGRELLLSGGFDPENVRRGVTPWPGLKTLAEYAPTIAAGQPPREGK